MDVAAGKSAEVSFVLPPLARAEVREEDFARWVLPTRWTVHVGGGQPAQAAAHATANTLSAKVQVTGSATALDKCGL